MRREPWSSGYGRQLMFERSWVQISAPNTWWTFFLLMCCKNCVVCLKRPKINKNEAGVGPFFSKKLWALLPTFVNWARLLINVLAVRVCTWTFYLVGAFARRSGLPMWVKSKADLRLCDINHLVICLLIRMTKNSDNLFVYFLLGLPFSSDKYGPRWGWKPWSSGYERRLMSVGSRV